MPKRYAQKSGHKVIHVVKGKSSFNTTMSVAVCGTWIPLKSLQWSYYPTGMPRCKKCIEGERI